MSKHCLPVGLADHWVTQIEELSALPPTNHIHWLTKPFVLSLAFKRAADLFNLELLNQRFGCATLDEVSKLSKYTHEDLSSVFVRQILLKDHEHVLCYGRVIIPTQTYQHHEATFKKVGSNPFGETVLYSNPDCKRSVFEYACMNHEGWGKSSNSHNTMHWARRSLFRLKGYPLLITEILMNDLPTYPVQHDDAKIPCL